MMSALRSLGVSEDDHAIGVELLATDKPWPDTALAKHLNLSRSTVRNRLADTIAIGWCENIHGEGLRYTDKGRAIVSQMFAEALRIGRGEMETYSVELRDILNGERNPVVKRRINDDFGPYEPKD
jgi:Mn-dependent DtxR family transcriptional regulator